MIIGAAIGVCANKTGCELAPDALDIKFDVIHRFDKDKTSENLLQYFTNLAELVAKSPRSAVIGGDHSCAIGTWSGIVKKHGEIGLIWVDAHMDSHTPETTITQNVHGMPLANLLGYGIYADILGKAPKLKPENVVLIGVRSYEEDERTLLERLGIKIFYSEDIKDLGAVLKETFDYFPPNLPIGMTIDMDAFDLKYAPGVNTPEPGGIDLEIFIQSVLAYVKKPLCALEIVEFNPTLDIKRCTARSVERLLSLLF